MEKTILLNEKAEIVNGRKNIFTDMVIAAHQDDIELMCPQGIVKGYQSDVYGLLAVVAADGSGSPRTGRYASYTDDEMKAVRRLEQIEAAKIGDYSALAMLNYSSAEIKDKGNLRPTDDLEKLLRFYRPDTVYIHNLADKHPTHTAVAGRSIDAIRRLPKESRPKKLYGCEVWRSLDWLPDNEKIIFDLTGHEELLRSLIAVYHSQIEGGKRYDLAAEGRRLANATFGDSHGVDKCTHAVYAMDLTQLIIDDTIDVKEFILAAIDRFKRDIAL